MSVTNFRRSRSLSLFRRRSAVDVTSLIATTDPLLIFHLFCLCLKHLVSLTQLPVFYLTLSSHMFGCLLYCGLGFILYFDDFE